MVEKVEPAETPSRNPCPYPEFCPLGAKAAGHLCRLSFFLKLCHPDGTPTGVIKYKCTFVELHLATYKQMIQAAQPQESQIIIAQQGPPPGVLPGPGNNGRRDR